MKILTHTLFLLATLVFAPYSFAQITPDMQVYCSAKAPKISFPFPGRPEIIKSPEFEEAYVYKDIKNINSYQFTYKKIDKTLNPKTYLEDTIKERLQRLNATLIDDRIYKSRGRTVSDYSYYYYLDDKIKLSHVKAVIAKDIYYSWAVQSYEDGSVYSADNIFSNYSKYVDNRGGFCK